jgi:TonB family protein
VLDAVRRTLTAPPRDEVEGDSARFAFPAAAAPGTDSLVVHLLFGERPAPGEIAVARFAVQERPVEPRSSIPPAYPPDLLELRRKGHVVMQFIVDSAGGVDTATMRVLRMDDRAFALAAMKVLPRYTFAPALLDCAPVQQLVQLPFTFDIEESTPFMSSRPRGDRSPLQPTTGRP